MGEVYRARDTTLRRDVAIKIVHAAVCHQPDSRERLRREARSLATLSHPHVAAVHEFGESETGCYIVMELVPGESLDAILARQRLGVREALRLCAQVAAALEAAHEKGLVHRDLKPANIRITPDGVAKVLDFGLAREDGPAEGAQGPTGLTTMVTEPGVVVGTVAYMSPEQARGQRVDRRTDIWAFGCVLFEMLTGHLTFTGPSRSDTIVAILERDPDWSSLPADTPAAVNRLLRRCLEKDVQRRLRDIGDARLEIEDALAPPAAAATTAVSNLPRGKWLPVVATLVLGLAAGALLSRAFLRPPVISELPTARFVVPLSAGMRFAEIDFPLLALSSDGSLLAYVATRGDRTQLFVRPMNGFEATPVAGSADAVSPFFSPDNEWIAFFADGKLKKAPVAGGAPVIICDAEAGFGGSWGADGTIVFAPAPGSPLWSVPAAGGTPSRLTRLDAERGEFSHRWPDILPAGRGVLFTVGTVGNWDDAEIVAQALDGRRPPVLIKGGTHPHYVATGHILYTHAGAAWAVPFDVDKLRVTGAPIRVVDDVLASFDGAAQLAISAAGLLAYVSGSVQQPGLRLVALDDAAEVAPLAAPARAYAGPRVSPDGRKVLLTVAGAIEEIWVYDMRAGTLEQLTFESDNRAPIWMRDGERMTFSSNRAGALNLFVAPAEPGGTAERLTTSDNIQWPGSWSPDGSVLAYVEHHPSTGRDIWLLQYDNRRATPFLNSTFDETAPAFSPDGRWVAYVSNQSGRSEVYVRSFANATVVSQVSKDGGSEPVWGRNGEELFYRAGGRLLAVPYAGGVVSRVDNPRVVFDGTFESGTPDRANFDVTPGARRFVMLTGSELQAQSELRVLVNWKPTAIP